MKENSFVRRIALISPTAGLSLGLLGSSVIDGRAVQFLSLDGLLCLPDLDLKRKASIISCDDPDLESEVAFARTRRALSQVAPSTLLYSFNTSAGYIRGITAASRVGRPSITLVHDDTQGAWERLKVVDSLKGKWRKYLASLTPPLALLNIDSSTDLKSCVSLESGKPVWNNNTRSANETPAQ